MLGRMRVLTLFSAILLSATSPAYANTYPDAIDEMCETYSDNCEYLVAFSIQSATCWMWAKGQITDEIFFEQYDFYLSSADDSFDDTTAFIKGLQDANQECQEAADKPLPGRPGQQADDVFPNPF